MQSQYGVPEMQQFMADGGCSPVFSIGTADMQASSQAQKQQQHHHHGHHGLRHQHTHQQHQQQAQRQLHHHQHLHLHHHHLPQMQLQQPVALPPPQAAFQHFHPIPVTQQLFQHGPQFQLFQQEQQRRIHQQLVHLGLEIESGPESSSSPTRSIIPAAAGSGAGGTTMPSFLGGASFKLAMNENSGGGGDSRDRLNDDEGILQGDEGSDTHIHMWNTTREEEPGIKEPFWRPLDLDYINRNNKRCKEKQAEPADSGKHCKSGREGENVDDGNNSASNYKLFSELEAIYKPVGGGGGGGGGDCSGGSSRAVVNNNQQTGSGSALTGENPQGAMAVEPQAEWGHAAEDVDQLQGSDTSTGGEEAAQIDKPNKSSGGSSVARRKRKRKQQLSSIAAFFESLVKRLMEHQEGLHRKFLEVLDRRDQERISREEVWRQQEAAKTSREATARAQEQALASSREAAIISFLENITGESLNLPTREQFQSQLPEESSQKEGPKHADQPDAYAVAPVDGSDADGNHNAGNADPAGAVNPSRWPKAEVQALIRVRSSLEARFQEPGLKGPLWEEVSAAMASISYQRSAKRCKEKWENINKYFRKTKDSPKKRSQQSKTCPYFHQLDQLYSKSLNKAAGSAAAAANPSSGGRDSSELLDALVVVPNELQVPCLRFPDVGAARQLDQSGSKLGDIDDDNHEGSGSATAGRRDMDVDGEDGEGDEEGEGDSQEQAAPRSRGRDDSRHELHGHSPRDVAVFFRSRLES